MQFKKAVRPGRSIPETKFRDGYEVKNKTLQDSGNDHKEPDVPGYVRRRAKVEREGKAAAG
jgi:hypothetical protein